jgi:NAD(P)-dependent dehydrogenase (short-subunit alcohol dehydrogenase family)
MKRWFDDHAVWITGGGTGIGKATALEFARHGANVAISGRRTDRLQGAVDEIEALGVKAMAVSCDVRDEDQIQAAANEVVRRFGKLDVALANAGYSVAGKVEDLGADDWRRQLETNIIGSALTARHALPHLRATRGRMAFIGSVAAFICSPKMGAYSASKFAVRALGHTLAIELHSSGVSVTIVHPGYVESEIAHVDNTGHFDPDREDRRPKNLMWPAERAAEVIVKAIYKRRRELVFTGHGKVGAFIGQHLPGVAHLMMTRGWA